MILTLTDDYVRGRTARHVPGAFYDSGAWHVELDGIEASTARTLVKLFPEHVDALSVPIQDVRPPNMALQWLNGVDPKTLLASGLKEKAYKFQAEDIAFAKFVIKANGGFYIAWDRGLGKTLAAIMLGEELQADSIIIITPNSSKDAVWVPQYRQWAPAAQVYNFGGTPAQRARAYKSWQYAVEHCETAVLLVHYEALRLLPEGAWCTLLIVDEAHRLANGAGRGSGVPQFYKRLLKVKSEYRLALSGSVLVNGVEDIFGAAHWLFPNNYKSKWKDWNNRFVHYVDTGYGKVPVGIIPGKEESLRNELAGWMAVRHKTDELPDLPERVEQTFRVTLSPGQRKAYDELADQFFTTLEDGDEIVVASALAQLSKLRQVATGLDLVSETVEDSVKLDLAIDMVQDNLPYKTVVFAWHRATVDALVERLEARGIMTAGVHGGIKQEVRAAHVRDFQDGETQVLVATIKTLGESVTLHAAADLIFVESSWTSADMDQAADRVYRIGQNRRVTISHIVAANTVDEFKVLPAVLSKDALRRAVLGG